MSRPAILVVILTASMAAADPKTDADGVPLPEGAIARLGSARFRFEGTPYCPPAVSPDGKQVAVGCASAISIFDLVTGRRLHRLALPVNHPPRSVRFLADGKRLAVGSGDWQRAAELTIWDLATEKALATANFAGKSQILVVDTSADGTLVLVEDRFAKVFLWDMAAGREVWAVEHKEATSTLPFTADGKHFVVSSYRKSELYNAATGKVVGQYPDPGPGFGQGYSPGLAGDGRIASRDSEGKSVAVLAAAGENRLRLLAAGQQVDRLFFSPERRFLVGCASDGIHTHVWDLTAPDDKGPIARLPSSTMAAFSPDGKMLALAGDGYLTLWVVGTWKPVPASADPPSLVYRAWLTPNGKSVLGYTLQGWVRWPAAGGRAVQISDGSAVHTEGFADVSADGRSAVDLLAEPGSGKRAEKCTLRLTDLVTGKDRRIPIDGSLWTPVQLSGDGRFVVADLGPGFQVFDARTGDALHRADRPEGGAMFGAAVGMDGKVTWSAAGIFRPDHRGLPGSGPMYSEVTLTDHRTHRKLNLDPMPWSVYSGGARFSRDGSKAVIQGRWESDWRKDSVTVWDTGTGQRLMKFDREAGRVASVALAADNRSLLAGGINGELALVEVATGGERMTFRHGGSVASSAFSSDGTKAVSTSPDGPVYVWDLLGEPARWDAAKADAVWNDLASSDAKVAFGAIRKLRANPAEAVAFLKERVKLPAIPSDEAVAKMLKGLDAAAFAERERSQRDLTATADLIRPKLKTARKTASEEAGRRLDQIVKAADGWTPDKLRHVRACEVIEWIGTPEAIGLLKRWAVGPEGARLTVESKESVARKSR